MRHQSPELHEQVETDEPAAVETADQLYAKRLHLAENIVERLRSAGMPCAIFDGVQPRQCL